ncbi:MAG TPA: mannose-1-phosphate guanylyltransferase [Candidatus Paenibacillus intestinavium]|nr:mannose-1-phosphate guanylyltransferase [Candidatus Paenibacillus intestinavium]
MKIILLSGGSGMRLWPLSNEARAKQFLRVLRNEISGELESMLERVYRQLLQVVNADDIIIVSNKIQVDMIHNQLGNVPIVVEPERRDTFPAIALATTYLYSELGIAEEEIVGVVSVDAFVDVVFYQKVKELEQLVQSTNAELGLIGVNPTYPSSKYGYLIPKVMHHYMEVGHFKEKPSEEEAEHLINNGAYWNSGVFSFRLQLILQKLKKLALPLSYNGLMEQFSKLSKNSFDYEVVEDLHAIVALTYDGYWKDLGTWNTLTEEMSQNVIGNGAVSEECENTHIVNELDLPVKVLGISNAVVAVSADGILVTDKPSSSRMKDMLHEGLFSRPMYVEHSWGSYRVLDFSNGKDGEVLTKRIHVKSGKNSGYHYHRLRSEVWTIISGKALFVQDDVVHKVLPGVVLQIPVGSKHCLYAEEDTELIEVQIGSLVADDDVVREIFDWNRIHLSNH